MGRLHPPGYSTWWAYFSTAARGLLVFTALIGLVMLPFILYWQPAVLGLPAKDCAIIAFSACSTYRHVLLPGGVASRGGFGGGALLPGGPLFAYALAYLVLARP